MIPGGSTTPSSSRNGPATSPPRSALACPALLLLLAGCASNISDVRLERVVPITAMELPPSRFTPRDPESLDGVIAEFSSTRDLRRQVARFGDSFLAVVERCAGHSRTGGPVWDGELVGYEGFSDEFGKIRDAGRAIGADPRHLEAASAVPRNVRFFFQLAIPAQTYARRQPIDSAGYVVRSVIYHDLRRDSDDLCVFARGWAIFQGVWRSNTVVIPHDAIRAALVPASGPAAR